MNDQAPEQQPIEAQAAQATAGEPDPGQVAQDPTPAPTEPATSEPASGTENAAPASADDDAGAGSDPAPATGPAVGSVVSWEHTSDQGVWTAYGLVVDAAVELGKDAEGEEQTAVRVARLGDLLVLDAEQLEQL